MRAAMAAAELDEANLQGLFHELTFIMTDALDHAGRLAMAINQSQTETRFASHAAAKALFALAALLRIQAHNPRNTASGRDALGRTAHSNLSLYLRHRNSTFLCSLAFLSSFLLY